MSLKKIEQIIHHEQFVNGEFGAIMITKPENLIYILGFNIVSDILILILREEPKDRSRRIQIFLNMLEYDEVKKKIDNDADLSNLIEIKKIPQGDMNYMENEINKLNIKMIGFEDDHISVKKFNDWKDKYSNSEFIGISGILSDARTIKTAEEIKRMKKAAQLGDIGFNTIIKVVKEGMTERELAAEAEYSMRKAGSDGTSFDIIVASGENSAYPHSTTSDKKIEDGDLIIVDIGAKYNGYCSDMTRTFIFGKINPEKAKLVNLVNECQQYVLDNIKAGLTCAEMDKLAREFFKNKNEEGSKKFIHSLGHGVGIEVHENPFLSPISKDVLKENMVVTIEPGLYFPGLGGARTEDQIIIKRNGFISLTKSKKKKY